MASSPFALLVPVSVAPTPPWLCALVLADVISLLRPCVVRQVDGDSLPLLSEQPSCHRSLVAKIQFPLFTDCNFV